MEIEHLRIQTIIKVIEGLRLEILDLNRAMHRAFFVVLTVLVIFGGIYFDDKIVKDENIRGMLLFALSQVLYLIVIFSGSCLANQNVHAGHIRSLEKQANKSLGGSLLIWESEITPVLLLSPRGTFFWACIFLYSGIFGAFFFLMIATLIKVGNIWLSTLIILELLIIIGIAIFSNFEFKRSEDLSNKILGSSNIKQG